MSIGLPGNDSPEATVIVSTEVLHQTSRTRLMRAHLGSGETVLFKQALGPHGLARMRNERSLLKRLAEAGVEGVPRLFDVAGLAQSALSGLAMFEVAGSPLSGWLTSGPVSFEQVLAIAVRLTRIVGDVHRCGVVHKDIGPDNVIVSSDGRSLTLIDFDLASTVAEDRPSFVHQSEIAGTLAYMAPEQTGRTGRAVDQRADLYALGATLYQLATGELPFPEPDPLLLVYAHLTRKPPPPHARAPTLPPLFSEIILKLLEKEPDSRYQSADGLLHDLLRVEQALSSGRPAAFTLGEHDFAARLLAPSRLVARDDELKRLHHAFELSLAGQCPGVLVAGAAGVGKTVLINEMRSVVTARRGVFVSGKFDQYRHDAASAISQAMTALVRMLLAEPEENLAPLRERIVRALGANAPLLAQQHEYMALLGPGLGESDELDGSKVRVRLARATLDMLRAVASPQRPVVVVIDDIQWAPVTSIEFLDSALSGEQVPGLLWLLSLRDAEVDAAHPLRATMARWERQSHSPEWLPLGNLGPVDTSALVGCMLRLEPEASARLVDGLGARCTGNPFDTVELINVLRGDGVLLHGDAGWHWNDMVLRGHVGSGNVVDLLSVRIARLPPLCRDVLQTLACLGSGVDAEMLQSAADLDAEAMADALVPALEDGLIVTEHSDGLALRFRHDRVQQAVYDRVEPDEQQARHLAIARRLSTQSAWDSKSAEQYLAACRALTDHEEQWRALALLRDTGSAIVFTNPTGAERMFEGALVLLASLPWRSELAPVAALLHARHHSALYLLGRLEEADSAYTSLLLHCSDALELTDAACVQIDSLSQRGHHGAAIALGIAMLAQLGQAPPAEEAAVGAEVMAGLRAFDAWISGLAQSSESERSDAADPLVRKAAKLIFRLSTPCHLHGAFTLSAWLMLKNMQLWIEHGPNADMACSASAIPSVLIALRHDFRTGRVALDHLLAELSRREHHTAAAFAQHMYAITVAPWFEPPERVLERARAAREVLLRAGDQHTAGYNYYTSLTALIACAPSLENCTQELEEALAFNARTRNADGRATLRAYQHALHLLRIGADEGFDEDSHLQDVVGKGMAAPLFHVYRALAAALLDDRPALLHHAAAGMAMLRLFQSVYLAALAHLLQGLALAQRVASAKPDVREALVSEFDRERLWMAGRAADAPRNFGHLLDLMDAERAMAIGDSHQALLDFDRALEGALVHGRAWHAALISERAARCHLATGLSHSGHALMVEACRLYQDWGAAAKVSLLHEEFVHLRSPLHLLQPTGTQSDIVSAASIDMLAIVRASQALSSQTSLELLQGTVVQLLAEMTGATGVMLALRHDGGWALPPGEGRASGMTVAEAGADGLLPLSAFWYVERTGEPLLVDDAARDDRFASDPYFQGLDQCSLLLVPVRSQGEPQAILLLENRLGRQAFSADRLDAVKLIAGQLAVSLNNVNLYASLERMVAERTHALREANERLAQLSITDPLTGLANRRRLSDVLQFEWTRACRSRGSIGLVMIDIDHFKRYNDHYGHLGGDDVLRLIAQTLLQVPRRGTDLVARYGGEEFAMVLPDTDFDGTRDVAERARRLVAGLSQPHALAELGFVTISVGVTAFVPDAADTVEKHLQVADAALYEAKRLGRNRVATAV